MKWIGVLVLLVTFVNSDAATSGGPHYSLNFDGVPVSCTARTGKLVPIYLDEAANRWGGGVVRTQPHDLMVLSPSVLKRLPIRSALFLFYHECAHLALPIGTGTYAMQQETNADCYAMQFMTRNKIVKSISEFREATVILRQVIPTWQHLPAEARIRNLLQSCVVDLPEPPPPPVVTQNPRVTIPQVERETPSPSIRAGYWEANLRDGRDRIDGVMKAGSFGWGEDRRPLLEEQDDATLYLATGGGLRKIDFYVARIGRTMALAVSRSSHSCRITSSSSNSASGYCEIGGEDWDLSLRKIGDSAYRRFMDRHR